MNKLTELARKHAIAARNVPTPPRMSVRVPLPRPVISRTDSRGRRRPVMGTPATVRNAAVAKARADLVAEAKASIIEQARKALT